MNRLFLIPALALSLSGCTAGEIASTGGGIAGLFLGGRPAAQAPAEQMDPDKLQTRVRLATAAFDRTTEAFESNRLPASTSPDTAHPKFCDMVILDLAQIAAGDIGGEAVALVCKAEHHLHEAKSAYENGNPPAFHKHIASADGFIDQLNAILAKGPTS